MSLKKWPGSRSGLSGSDSYFNCSVFIDLKLLDICSGNLLFAPPHSDFETHGSVFKFLVGFQSSPSESHGVHRLGASRLLVAARVAEPHLAEMRKAFTSSAGPDATFARKTANSLAFSVFCPAGHWLCSAYQIVVLFRAVTKFHARCMYKWLINSSEFGFLFAGDWPSLALV